MSDKKILITEDDNFLANSLRVKLTQEKFIVEVAQNGKILLEKIQNFQPDLIKLDLMMPEIDGFEALKKIKENSEFEQIPVIVISNLSQEEDKKEVMQLGAKDYLIKSDVSLAAIVQKINSLI